MEVEHWLFNRLRSYETLKGAALLATKTPQNLQKKILYNEHLIHLLWPQGLFKTNRKSRVILL